MQEQDQDLTDPHPLCCEIALPGACLDEHCCKNVYEEVRHLGALSFITRTTGGKMTGDVYHQRCRPRGGKLIEDSARAAVCHDIVCILQHRAFWGIMENENLHLVCSGSGAYKKGARREKARCCCGQVCAPGKLADGLLLGVRYDRCFCYRNKKSRRRVKPNPALSLVICTLFDVSSLLRCCGVYPMRCFSSNDNAANANASMPSLNPYHTAIAYQSNQYPA